MLIVGADSWGCWPQEEFYGSREKCWPSLVAKSLKMDLIDHSRAGCSNDRIFRYCLPDLGRYPKSTAIIIWSQSQKFEVGHNGKIEQIMPSLKNDIIPKQYVVENLDLYLQYCRTMLYALSIQETCKSKGIRLLQKFCFSEDCWWDGTLESFKDFLRKANTFDHLSDDQIMEKFTYVEELHALIDEDCWLGRQDEALSDIAEVSEEFKSHPTDKGHKQIADVILQRLKQQGP